MIPCTFGLRPADGLLHSNKYLADIMLFEETTCLLPVHSTWELINLALGETELKKTFTLTQNISHTLRLQVKYRWVRFLPVATSSPGAVSLLEMLPEVYGFSESCRCKCNEQKGCWQETNKRQKFQYTVSQITEESLVIADRCSDPSENDPSPFNTVANRTIYSVSE